MSITSYWRGYVDAQNKKDYMTEVPFASGRKKQLQPLAEIFETTVQEYRSGYRVMLHQLNKRLPQVEDKDYIRGWFHGSGKRYKDPIKLTVSGENVKDFIDLVDYHFKLKLPKPQQPSKTSRSMRVIITGEKATELLKHMKATA